MPKTPKRKVGRPKIYSKLHPKDEYKTVLRIKDKDLVESIKKMADDNERTINAEIIVAIKNHVK